MAAAKRKRVIEVGTYERPEYESIPKHKEPWQPGKRGSLCKEVSPVEAQKMLVRSLSWTNKRYAVRDGRPYVAHEHEKNKWHGYPVGWKEVPHEIRSELQAKEKVRNRDIKRFWSGERK